MYMLEFEADNFIDAALLLMCNMNIVYLWAWLVLSGHYIN
jgi:hypothetical protein